MGIVAERDRDSLDAEFGFGACTVSEGEFGYTVKVRNRRTGGVQEIPEKTGDGVRNGRRSASAFKGCATRSTESPGFRRSDGETELVKQ